MATIFDDKKFGMEFLDDIVAWITNHFSADEIYQPDAIKEAIDNLNWGPEDVFTEAQLEMWAEENDYIREE